MIRNQGELNLENIMMNCQDEPHLRNPNSETIHNSNTNVEVSLLEQVHLGKHKDESI